MRIRGVGAWENGLFPLLSGAARGTLMAVDFVAVDGGVRIGGVGGWEDRVSLRRICPY